MTYSDDKLIYKTFNPANSGLLGSSDLQDVFERNGACILNRGISNDTVTAEIDGVSHQFMSPITFTPYASSKPCSARCWFCSENLKMDSASQSAANIRPNNDYHLNLKRALNAVKGLPVGLSMSGLEITDDRAWLLETISVISEWEREGGSWMEKSAYTNGAGLVGEAGKYMIEKLASLNFDRVELSRHHFDSKINQKIMRFRVGEAIQNKVEFRDTLHAMQKCMPVTLVCIVQKGGVESHADVDAYIHWAKRLGVQKVIFRALCEVSDSYVNNNVFRMIRKRRIEIEDIINNWVNVKSVPIIRVINGYYFWNVSFDLGELDVVFERSDYGLMNTSHQSNVIRKLVFFANGNLCADWNPDSRVLARFNHGE